MQRKLANAGTTTLRMIAATSLAAMMLLTTCDVVLRKFANRPITGALELTELLMVLLIFSGLPLVSAKGEHVSVDLFEHWLPQTLRGHLSRFVHLLSALALAGLSVLMWRKADQTRLDGDVTAALSISLAPFVYCMSALIACAAIIHLFKTFSPNVPQPQ